MYGFGGVPPWCPVKYLSVSKGDSFFPLNGEHIRPTVEGVDGMVKLYKDTRA